MNHIRIVPKGTAPFPGAKPTPIGLILYNPFGDDYKGKTVAISLHGKGDGGTGHGEQIGLERYAQKSQHLPFMLENGYYLSNGKQIPFERPDNFIVVMPQTQYGYLEGAALVKFRNWVAETFATEMIAIMGLSAGGASVWKAFRDYPELFKAFVPISGAYLQNDHQPDFRDRNRPLWAHHGSRDSAPGGVDPVYSIRNCSEIQGGWDYLTTVIDSATELPIAKIDELKQDFDFIWISGEWEPLEPDYEDDLILSIYANAGHGIWPKVYCLKNLWGWMEYQLNNTGEQPPQQEERPLKHLTDAEIMILEYLSLPDLVGTTEIEISIELQKRADEIIKKYDL